MNASTLAVCLALALLAPAVAAQPEPWTTLDLARVDGRTYIAGRPSGEGLRAFAGTGGKVVIDLRSDAELARSGFDEGGAARALGLVYVHIPVTPKTFSRADVEACRDVLDRAEGYVLMHCSSGNRAAGMVAARGAIFEGMTIDAALARAEAVGPMREGMALAVRRVVFGVAPELPGQIAADVSPEHVRGFVDGLCEFTTRHTLSDTESDTVGIGAARRWIKSEFERIGRESGRVGDEAFVVEFDAHTIPPDRRVPEEIEVVNVRCVIPGAMPGARDRLYYMIGHYDSRNSDPMDPSGVAPGANDDGSGVAACLEVARVLAGRRLDATVVLMPTAGEEQGLHGARAHAAASRRDGLDIRAVLSNDIVGDPTGPDGRVARHEIRVFSEGLSAALFDDGGRMRGFQTIRSYAAESDGVSRQLARYIAEVAEAHDLPVRPRLIFRPDRFLRGGDHTGFNEAGFAAVRFTETYENYTHQHQDVRVVDGVQYGDLPEFVDEGYLADVARLNVATIVHLANAPSEPANPRIIVAELTHSTTIRWEPSPEPDVAGYEVVWRDTTSPVWEHARTLGDVTEATIDLSKDNWFFGVRAYDHDGYRSTVAFPRAARQ